MAENKTIPTDESVSAFIAALNDPGKQADCNMLIEMMRRLTGAEPVLWGPSIVGFGKYHYVYDSGREGDAMLAGFSPRKNELVVYLMGKIPDQAELLDKLGRHRMGKACLYIKRLEKVDLAVLETLISKSIAALKAKYRDVG